MWRNIVLPAIVSIFTLFSSTLFATDRLVPSQYVTIQAAIDASFNGDTVNIADGTYTGTGNYNIDFGGKAITVRSQNGPTNCIIDCQSSGRGFYFHSSETNSSIISGLTIKNGLVSTTPSNGGGIYCTGASPTINNCIFSANQAVATASGTNCLGGGICCISNSNPRIINCVLSNNTAYGFDAYTYDLYHYGYSGGSASGGGIYSGSDCNPTIQDCNIAGNTAWGGDGSSRKEHLGEFDQYFGYDGGNAYGGGIYCSSAIVKNCLITNNKASGGSEGFDDGGGAPRGGSAYGGAVKTGTATIINCTIVNNLVQVRYLMVQASGSMYGGGINGDNTSGITDCIIWGNGDDLYGCSATYSCIEDGDTGTGNISLNPLFVSGHLGNYYLSQVTAGQAVNSPCVDSGSKSAEAAHIKQYTTRTDEFPDDGAVDMGYHYSSLISPDIDKNLNIDFSDYAIMASDWLLCDNANPLRGDINKDDCVNENDLDILINRWLDCYVNPAIILSPLDNAAGVLNKNILSWMTGNGAVFHNIYFGTSFADINSADTSSAAYWGQQSAAIWDPNNYNPVGFDYNKTYYWRIDEVGPACTSKGDVWSFTTISGKASYPTPADAATSVDSYPTFSWSPAPYATSHDIYLGTSLNDVNSSTIPTATTTSTSYNLGFLNLSTTYYWRIDEFDGSVKIKGDIWNFTTSAPFDPNSNLLAWWKLDETTGTIAHDSAGTLNGTLQNNPFWAAGQINGALDFSGDDAVDISGSSGTSSSLNRYNSNITICAWVKIRGSGGTIVARAKSGYITYNLGTTSNSVYINSYRSSTWSFSTSAILNLDTWYHIVGVYDRTGDKGRIYVNGVKQVESAMTTDPYSNSATTKIGCRNSSTDQAFNGVIDDVRIYSRVLTNGEVQQLYESGLP